MLVALRHVVDEPLGAVRRASIGRRRGRWRLLPALAGPALLLTLPEGIGWEGGPRDYAQLAGGTTLSLLGVAVLSPWLVEAAVRRLNGGPLSWTLAARRLQRGSATTLRTVAVVSITVTGAIALQMLFSAADREYYSDTFREAGLLRVDMPATAKPADGLARALFAAQGVRSVHTYSTSTVTLPPVSDGDFTFGGMTSKMIVGDCPTLRKLAGIADCADGDVFAPLDEPNVVDTRDLADPEQLFEQIADAGYGIPGPGLEVTLGVPGDLRWALPPDTKKVTLRDNGEYWSDVGVLATPAALPADFQSAMATVTGVVRVDPDDPDAEDNVVAAIAGLGRLRTVDGVSAGSDPAPVGLRAAGYVGIVAVFGLVGAGLVAAVAEESRERRRTLAALAAVGARRRTVAVSVLWQTAIPLILGVTLALGAGLGLGAALLRLAGVALSIPWANIAVACATMFAVVLGTTAASLPVLRRMMRPDGLRIE
ncbi:FtsX-like permease family protein [Parafrankia sp. FMc6]|uniref:FtsX-like permease family protein n=1 Tax=Parafrankia soli TaxID=2599596 RepID=UPI0034D4527A